MRGDNSTAVGEFNVLGSITDVITGTVYPAGTLTYYMRCANVVPITINTNSIQQLALPVMTADDYGILSSGVLLGLVMAFGIRTVRRLLERVLQ